MAADAPCKSSESLIPSPQFNSHYSSHTQPYRASPASRSISYRSISMTTRVEKPSAGSRKTCICSPTTHPGSFRCRLHKSSSATSKPRAASRRRPGSRRLDMRRSAIKNSMMRIGAAEGDWVKVALGASIRTSFRLHRRRREFLPRPSRLSVMTKAQDCE